MASEHQVTLRSSLIGVNEPGSVETELLPKGRIILQAILEFDFQMGKDPHLWAMWHSCQVSQVC